VRNTSTVAAAGLTAISTPAQEAFSPVIPGALGETHGQTHSMAQRESGLPLGGTGNSGSSSVGRSGAVTKRSVSQREKWVKEPYLRDKLTAGAAALKVRPWQGHNPVLQSSCKSHNMSHSLSQAITCFPALSTQPVGTANPTVTVTNCQPHATLVVTLHPCYASGPQVPLSPLCPIPPLQALQQQPAHTSQLAVTGWSIEAALAASPLTCRLVGLADVERRLAVADPGMFLEYQVCGEGGGGQVGHLHSVCKKGFHDEACRGFGGRHCKGSATGSLRKCACSLCIWCPMP
jgi:hypothetical protein